jgi:transcriptional regulator with XRE-family HTH domain
MKTKKAPLLPVLCRQLKQLGENLRLARRRRNITSTLLAERAGMSRQTLLDIEKGEPGVSMGAYASVLMGLGLEKEIAKLAMDDELGRKLQDANLLHVKSKSV